MLSGCDLHNKRRFNIRKSVISVGYSSISYSFRLSLSIFFNIKCNFFLTSIQATRMTGSISPNDRVGSDPIFSAHFAVEIIPVMRQSSAIRSVELAFVDIVMRWIARRFDFETI